MTKKIFVFFTIFILNLSTVIAAPKPNTNTSAENQNASVIDTSKTLTANQIKTLSEKIHQLEQKHKIRAGIYFFENMNGQNVDTVAHERLRKYFNDGENGGAILVVDIDNRKWDIAIDAKLNQRILSYNDVAYKTDDFYDNLHNDNFAGACNAYIDNLDELLNYYEKNGTPYDSFDEFNPMAFGLAILLAIVLGFGIREWLIGLMSNVKFASEASDYLKRDSIKINESRDTYLYTNVSRQAKVKNSNGGSGRSSGGGSSGGGSF